MNENHKVLSSKTVFSLKQTLKVFNAVNYFFILGGAQIYK
jgi:hypothetical protein